MFDSDFNFRKHISLTCCSCFYNILDLRRIRCYISLSVAKSIATSLVTIRPDYCNSLLYNIASKDTANLQCVQNYLARVITRSPRFSHSVLLLKLYHWLPVQSLIMFKLYTVTYQTLSSGEPLYLFSIQIVLSEHFTPEQRPWIHPLHPLHCIDLFLTPFPHAAHSYFPVLSTLPQFFPETIAFILLMLNFNPFASMSSFHLDTISFSSSHALRQQRQIICIQQLPLFTIHCS